MSIEVTWRPSAVASGLHAAEAMARKQPIADSRLAAALREPALQLANEIRAAHLPSARFWGHLIPLSATISGRKQLVETAVTKTVGRGPRFEFVVSSLIACVAAVENAVKTALPNLNEELPMREGPLREQWEARGPGMLQHIGRLTDES